MAVANTFTFGGVSTTTYGVIVEGSGDYSGAKRAVEMISIPGRDGAFALDKGYYENEPVEYDVLIQGATQATFETAVSSFRNAILSKKGYQRLTDTYHPNEYRMAVYAGGFDDEPTFHGKGASFKVKFDCKPQRWLISGETAVSVDDGDTLLNPTLFDAKPLLEVEGYGNIGFNGYNVHIDDVQMGTIDVSNQVIVQNQSLVRTWDINEEQYNPGDEVIISGLNVNDVFTLTSNHYYIDSYGDRTMGIEYYNTTDSDATLSYSKSGKTAYYGIAVPDITLTIGQNLTKSYSYRATVILDNTASNRNTCTLTITYADGTLAISVDQIRLYNAVLGSAVETCTIELGSITGDSSLSILDNTIYIDCDLGEAYTIIDGSIISLNHIVDLGSDLPKLSSGANTITYDNTITSLKITPRWQKV